ncbi:hypothetical protein [Alcanivorax sp. 1008]|uniref:hypothetical protein n=1 Tax=Alcanivorax sp. 1008 TaxID=2816853 RepID=UPI001D8C2652|nr:hypothetical protein [Alcanivorax sp. 1008]MCC1496761.1 hypothetical protein [Alcanivorax sp. 1008]
MSNDKIRVQVSREVTSIDTHVVYMTQEEFDRMKEIDELHEKAEYAIGLPHALLDGDEVMDSALRSIEIGTEKDARHEVLLADDESAHSMVVD